jgi:hypothetical protein
MHGAHNINSPAQLTEHGKVADCKPWAAAYHASTLMNVLALLAAHLLKTPELAAALHTLDGKQHLCQNIAGCMQCELAGQVSSCMASKTA